MIKALAIKELRESAGLFAIAALALAYVVSCEMGINAFHEAFITGPFGPRFIPFIGGDFYGVSLVIGGSLGILLGLKQSAWEIQHNTFLFLLHRPMSRRQITTVKLLVGGLLVFLLLAIAIVIYGIWAAIPGHVPAPFEWSMTFDSWMGALALPIVYLGGYLSGMRPARWFGTRLLPLLAATLFVSFALGLIEYWWLQVPLIAAGYAGLLVSINYFAHSRDY